ncbi:MAG TPA: dTDP-4-dehydrorhamnose reductase [Bacteroidota bacterium]|nr:dTDP-4-dehydrorhamnose reductase [Bacteroidota bacterium]
MKKEPRRVVITGSNGLLGQKVTELLSQSQSYTLHLISSQEESVFGADTAPYTRVDISDRKQVTRFIEGFQPDTIINTAAVTNVDACETNREVAWKVNVHGVENLVHAGKLSGSHIVQLSTDYVFDGKGGPYAEDDRPNPLSYYGRTKLAAENLLRTSDISHTIVRTMVLYGQARKVKPNFALWLITELKEGRTVKVVSDQIGNPTLADDLAFGITKIVELKKSGVYHIAGPDIMSRLAFAKETARIFQLDGSLIHPQLTAALKQPAPRPLKSGLIILKAQVDLNLPMSGVESGLLILRNQLSTLRHPVEIPQ